MPGIQPQFTQERADEICRRIAEGEPLAVICRDNDDMPTRKTVSVWRKAHPEFDVEYLAARDIGYDVIAERTRATARGKGPEDGGDSAKDVARDKLIIETDLKLLAKWDPRRYGDRHILAGDPEAPLQNVTEKQLDDRIEALLEKAAK